MLIIDAYNLLHTPMPASLAGLDVAGLCQFLARTAWARRGVRVVCDGAPGPLGLLESPADSVELIYSGPHRTADELIIKQVDDSSAPRRLVVVSSDREIRRAARRRRATAWTSETFIHRLATAACHPAPQPRPDKPAPDKLDDHETRAWLREFGLEE